MGDVGGAGQWWADGADQNLPGQEAAPPVSGAWYPSADATAPTPITAPLPVVPAVVPSARPQATYRTPPRRRGRRAGPITWLLALVFVFFAGGAWIYGHSASFKAQCLIQKEGGPHMPFPKGPICDVMFDVKPR